MRLSCASKGAYVGELGDELVLGRRFQALAFTQRFLRGAQAEARIEDFANDERAQYADRHGDLPQLSRACGRTRPA